MEIRLVVEEYPVVPAELTDRELSHGEVTFDPVLAERENEVIKMRILRRPEFRIRNGNAVVVGNILLRNKCLAVIYGNMKRAFALKVGLYVQNTGIDIGSDPIRFYIAFGDIFKPHCLPYAARCGVPETV